MPTRTTHCKPTFMLMVQHGITSTANSHNNLNPASNLPPVNSKVDSSLSMSNLTNLSLAVGYRFGGIQ